MYKTKILTKLTISGSLTSRCWVIRWHFL